MGLAVAGVAAQQGRGPGIPPTGAITQVRDNLYRIPGAVREADGLEDDALLACPGSIVPTRQFDPRGVIACLLLHHGPLPGQGTGPALVLDERPHVVGENHLGSLELALPGR